MSYVTLSVTPTGSYRSINYDEKDPFLCNTCGFCKYAKFEVTLTAKACSAVDPITNEEDRAKVRLLFMGAVSSVHCTMFPWR